MTYDEALRLWQAHPAASSWGPVHEVLWNAERRLIWPFGSGNEAFQILDVSSGTGRLVEDNELSPAEAQAIDWRTVSKAPRPGT